VTSDDILKELAGIEGCLGGFVTQGETFVASSLHAFYKPDMLTRAAQRLAALAGACERAGLGVPEIVADFDKGKLLVLPVGHHALLNLVCEAGASIAKVELLAGIAVDHLREYFDANPVAAAGAAAAAPAPAPAEAPAAAAPAGTPAELRAQAYARHGPKLEGLKKILIHHVGPIGEMLFNRHVDRWLAAGPIDWRRAKDLRVSLMTELDDPKAKNELGSSPLWTQL
jgi:predicted regulator of Ras-like GTPase activity (Roadblock/LC7/MglB family)